MHAARDAERVVSNLDAVFELRCVVMKRIDSALWSAIETYDAAMRLAFILGVVATACACVAAPLSPSKPMNTDLPADLQSMLPALREDAARRSGAGAAELQVASVEDVTWADGALGCATPGQTYTMALVPGWRIVLATPQGALQHYHASRRGHWLWCAAERSRTPPGALQRL
jgi:hypothetical protein